MQPTGVPGKFPLAPALGLTLGRHPHSLASASTSVQWVTAQARAAEAQWALGSCLGLPPRNSGAGAGRWGPGLTWLLSRGPSEWARGLQGKTRDPRRRGLGPGTQRRRKGRGPIRVWLQNLRPDAKQWREPQCSAGSGQSDLGCVG